MASFNCAWSDFVNSWECPIYESNDFNLMRGEFIQVDNLRCGTVPLGHIMWLVKCRWGSIIVRWKLKVWNLPFISKIEWILAKIMLLKCYVGKNIRPNVKSRSPTYCVYIKSIHQYTLSKYILIFVQLSPHNNRAPTTFNQPHDVAHIGDDQLVWTHLSIYWNRCFRK